MYVSTSALNGNPLICTIYKTNFLGLNFREYPTKNYPGKRPQTVEGWQKETRLVVVMMMTMTHR